MNNFVHAYLKNDGHATVNLNNVNYIERNAKGNAVFVFANGQKLETVAEYAPITNELPEGEVDLLPDRPINGEAIMNEVRAKAVKRSDHGKPRKAK